MTIVVDIANQHYGWGHHVWDFYLTDPARIQGSNILAYVAKIVYTLAATFTRFSLCFFYYRLVKNTGIKWFTWVVHATMAYNVIFCLYFVLGTVFQCTPVQYYWEFPPRVQGHCRSEGNVVLASGIMNVFADTLTTLVPLPLVLKLNLPLRQRIGVSVLFCLGSVVVITGAVRTYYIWKTFFGSWDETWYAYALWLTASLEVNIGIICACLPALKTLLHFSRVTTRLSRPAFTHSSYSRQQDMESNRLPSLPDGALTGPVETTNSHNPSSESKVRSFSALYSQTAVTRTETMKSQDDESSFQELSVVSDRTGDALLRQQSVELESPRHERTRTGRVKDGVIVWTEV